MGSSSTLLAGAPLPGRLYGNRRSVGATPLVLHLHGGAFTCGGLDCGAAVATLIAEAGARVVSIDYPLAPAHPFPKPLEAAHEALVWLHKQRNRLAGPGALLFVAGEEAGGNLAAGLAMMARDRQRPPLAGQILIAPMLDPCTATASMREAQAGHVGCTWADGWRKYLSRASDAGHPYAAPASSSRLADMPPAFIASAPKDGLRDEARAYAERLRQAGVPVQQAMVGCTQGWPKVLGEAPCGEAAWADELREQLKAYFAGVIEPAGRIAPSPRLRGEGWGEGSSPA